jgi:tetratricopeptide (TPR) repeat protein
VALDGDDPAEAGDYARRRVELARSVGSIRSELAALWACADVARRQVDAEALLALGEAIADACGRLGNAEGQLEARELTLSALMILRRFEDAEEAVTEWLAAAEQFPGLDRLQWVCALAVAQDQQGKHELAARSWRDALPGLRERGLAEPLASALTSLARCELAAGTSAEATGAAEELVALTRAAADPWARHDAMMLLAQCRRAGKHRLAAWELERAARRLVAGVRRRSGDTDTGRKGRPK